jgi:hypothetical protein
MKRKTLFAATLILMTAASTFALVYNGLSTPPLLQPGDVFIVWNSDSPTPGNGTTAASQQVVLQPGRGDGVTPFSVDAQFSGAPGAFEVDVQVASKDSDTSYQTCSNCNITTVDSTNNTFTLQVPGNMSPFVRLLMRSRTNSVSIIARIKR